MILSVATSPDVEDVIGRLQLGTNGKSGIVGQRSLNGEVEIVQRGVGYNVSSTRKGQSNRQRCRSSILQHVAH